jgi:aryl-alcohol dehydrogenase-like predicted oxidoreductase
VHPIAALQTEYSLWTRNPEIAVLNTCQDLDVAFVAFSPLGRGFLSGQVQDSNSLVHGDIRKGMPRFQSEQAKLNQGLLRHVSDIILTLNCTMAQLSLAWLLHQGNHVIPIPGTTQLAHLSENMAASEISLSEKQLALLDEVFNYKEINGPRYPAATQMEIDTEEF